MNTPRLLPRTIAVMVFGVSLACCLVWSSEATALTEQQLVFKVQQRLLDFGYSPGPVDGKKGPKTTAALKKFQQDYRLTVTGEIDRPTLEALGFLVQQPTPAPQPTPTPQPQPTRPIQPVQPAPQPQNRSTQSTGELYPSVDNRSASRGQSERQSLIQPARGGSLPGHLGAGVWLSLMNFGIGPSVEFYPVNHVGIMGTVGALFDYTSVSARLLYMLSSVFDVGGELALHPYVGAGFTYVMGPEIQMFGTTVEQHGTGFEAYGGALMSLDVLLKNFYVRGEFIYSNINMKTTVDGEDFNYTGDTLDWGSFGVGFGATYFF